MDPFGQLSRSPSQETHGPCVYRKDVGFHYMMDAAHSPDTLFIVAEADFRFYKADDMSPAEWANEVLKEKVIEASAHSKAPPSAPSSSARGHPYDKKPHRFPRAEGGGFVAGGQKVDEDDFEISQELQDTVTVCNEADRLRP